MEEQCSFVCSRPHGEDSGHSALNSDQDTVHTCGNCSPYSGTAHPLMRLITGSTALLERSGYFVW
jgi:hypothetical protein